MHTIPIERNTFDSHHVPMGVTGTWLELPESALNIICISLKFLHTSAWNPPIWPIPIRLLYYSQPTLHARANDVWVCLVT